MKKIRTYFAMITHNRSFEALDVVRNIYPHVDRLVIIDGGSTDGTLEGLREIAESDYVEWFYDNDIDFTDRDHRMSKKLHIVHREWRDNFPRQRQTYVDVIGKLREQDEDSWIIVSDSDEFFSERLRKQLKVIISNYAEPNRFTMLKVRAKDIELDPTDDSVVSENLAEYWKELIYKWNPNLQIVGDHVHEGFNMGFRIKILPDNVDKGKEFEILYEHRKRIGVVWERAHSRNFFIRGGGPNLGEKQKLWRPFREMIDPILMEKFDLEAEDLRWHHYKQYLVEGEVSDKLKLWFIRYALEGEQNRPDKLEFILIRHWRPTKTFTERHTVHLQPSLSEGSMGYGYDGASEVREGYKYYFRILHPEEEPDQLKEMLVP